MHQTSETIPTPNPIDDRGSGRRGSGVDAHRRAKCKASVRPLVVVVPHVLAEHSLKVTPTPNQHPIQTLLRTVRTHRSANALAFGALIGVVMILVPSEANTSSKARVNLLSRS
jgi:hypothetical protein